ncbi:MAG: PAS domain-containing protein, partial [Bacteroidetes bacterium]|nr:PAS domain-containing protein [Bacteroidota bacterium]
PISGSLYSLDYAQLDLLLQSAIQLQGLEYIEILESRRNKEIKRSIGDPNTRKDIVREFSLSHSSPDLSIPYPVGTLMVVGNFDKLYERTLEKAVVVIATNAVKVFFASFCIMMIFQSLITRHLIRIAKFTQQMELKKQYVSLTLDRKAGSSFKPDEFDQVVGALNNMQKKISLDIKRREDAEKQLKKSEKKYHSLFTSVNEGVCLHSVVYDQQGQAIDYKILETNPAYERILSIKPEEANNRLASQLYGTDTPPYMDIFFKVVETGEPVSFETFFPPMKKHFKISVFSPAAGQFATLFADITEQKKGEKIRRELEAQLRQSQKIESIGNLAGGIAHDFNNLLFPIIGMSEMLLEDLPQDSLEYENVQEIFIAGRRAGDLVQQILAFSRQSEHKMTPVRVQNVLKEVLKLTRSTIPSNIEIHENIQQDCGLIMADPTQVHQVAMNLITNAYHAIEDKNGAIDIKLEKMTLQDNELPDTVLQSGQYVRLSVSDNGIGMSQNTISKIFEPYFTTKKQGKGTGLGLAVVYGIVKEHGGDIKVYSEIEKGTTFNIYLPLMKKVS